MNPPRQNVHNISYRVNTTTVIKHNSIIPMTTSLHCRVTRPDKCNSHCVVGVSRVSLAAVSTAILRNYSDRINVSFIRPQMRIHYDDDKGGGYVILISRERVFVRCQSGLTTPSTFRLPTTIIIRLI